jgi:hypothetical protein
LSSYTTGRNVNVPLPPMSCIVLLIFSSPVSFPGSSCQVRIFPKTGPNLYFFHTTSRSIINHVPDSRAAEYRQQTGGKPQQIPDDMAARTFHHTKGSARKEKQ